MTRNHRSAPRCTTETRHIDTTHQAGEYQAMNCLQVQELLSPYYDRESSSDADAAVTQHLASCERCSRELEGFRRLSKMADSLPHPVPPAQLWRAIGEKLDAEEQFPSQAPGLPEQASWIRRTALRGALAIAAIVLIALGGWWGYQSWFGNDGHGGDAEFASVFGRYLDEFDRDPTAAQQYLVVKYGGEMVDAAQAERTVGYRPAIAGGMPTGYTVESTCVMEMPCCTCVHCNCRRDDGTTLAIFEHDDEEVDWFGDWPVTEKTIGGRKCQLVTLGDRLAATWQSGVRYITVVGAKNQQEIGELVAWFDERNQLRSH